MHTSTRRGFLAALVGVGGLPQLAQGSEPVVVRVDLSDQALTAAIADDLVRAIRFNKHGFHTELRAALGLNDVAPRS